jgi:branched-chain amino acid transport system permease protein
MLLWQLVVNGLLAAGVYALVAVGFGLIYRTTRFFNFAHGAVYTLGAYLAFWFHQTLGFHPVVSSILAIAGGALAGIATWILIFGPLKRAGASELTLLLASVGIFTVGQNAISAIFSDATLALGFGALSGTLTVLGAGVTVLQLAIACAAFLLCLAVSLVLWRSRFGNAILAVGADPDLSEISGINSNVVTLQVFGIGSALAALAGILVGMDTDITPLMGYSAMLSAVVAVIIGGTKSPLGWLVGAIILGLAQTVGVWRVESHWRDTIVFTLLIFFMIFRPKGIVRPLEARR